MADVTYSSAAVGASLRLGRLDGLRGVAACVVAFAYHPQGMFTDGIFQNAGPVLNWFHAWGWTFVDLFFLISGYIFAHVYLGADKLRSAADVGEFAVARFARLYPLHLLMLVATALLFWGKPENTPFAFLGHLVMMQAFVQPVAHTFVGPAWSLSVEVVCYVLFALGAAAGPRGLRLVTGLAIGIALVAIVLFGNPGGPWVGDNLPRALLGFFLGQVLWRYRAQLAQIPWYVLGGLMVYGLWFDAGQASPLIPLCLVAWPAAVLLALRLPLLDSKPMLWLGDRSYAIYLIHQPLIELVLKHTGPLSGGLWFIAGVHVAVIAATLVLADLALRWIEYPARRAIRTAWTRRTLQPAAA